MKRPLLLVEFLLVAALTGILSCASSSGRNADALVESPAIRLRVVNGNWSRCNIYVARYSMRLSLGSVEGMMTENLKVRASDVSPDRSVNIYVRCIGSDRSYLSELTALTRGSYLELTLGQNIESSFVSVFPLARLEP